MGDRLHAATFGRGLRETPVSTTGISVISTELPFDYLLGQNYPNPFNPVTKINFQIPARGNVTMKAYNQLGQEVGVHVNKIMDAGYYSTDFDASKLSSGIYFYKLTAGNFTQTQKMMLIK
ncbi:MAG: T9SS type A sorting domain-containing protein [Ignavibacteria bacterium]